MDFLKTLLIYMVALLSASTGGEVLTTPIPPSAAATPTAYVTMAPTRAPTVAPTLAPTRTPSPTPIVYTTLYVGDRGENVKRLQRRLTELGYLNDTIDGIYGQKTKRAVERFQYYNGLNSDGVAGQSTQYMLYESRNVVLAPPDISPTPSPSPTPYVQRQVYVPIYYVDQSGTVLARTGLTMYASGTIYADGNYIPAGYYLSSSSSVYIYLNGNYATPASVTFTCARQATATPNIPAPVYIPVYYMAEDDTILYITTCSLTRGATTAVYAQNSLVDSRYYLISASSVSVYVNQSGTASPASVIFRYRDRSAIQTAAPTVAPTPAPISYNVYYLTEFDELLYVDTVYLPRVMVSTVYANSSLVPRGYQLMNASAVQVTVSADGSASPSQVNFRYRNTATQPPTVTSTPTNAPALPPVSFNVYYLAENDDWLYTDTMSLGRGVTWVVRANDSFVSPDYQLVGTSAVDVYIAEDGSASPVQVTFRYRKLATPPPIPDPTETPTPIPDPTETPTPVPTETPPPVPDPTETPPPPPVVTVPPPSAPSGVLQPGGTTIEIGGVSQTGGWYQNDSGAPYIALDRLASLLNVSFSDDGATRTCTLNGHSIAVGMASGEEINISIDGADRTSQAFRMNGGLYLDQTLLSSLGIGMTTQGDTMILTVN